MNQLQTEDIFTKQYVIAYVLSIMRSIHLKLPEVAPKLAKKRIDWFISVISTEEVVP